MLDIISLEDEREQKKPGWETPIIGWCLLSNDR